jgi:thymidylate synthase (FAD)
VINVQIDLLTHTPEPLRVLWTATRTCKSAKSPQELWGDYPGDDVAIRLLHAIWHAKHYSIFEHVTLTYAVTDVSRILLAQYTRHRIGINVSVQSGRSVQQEEKSFYFPGKHKTYGKATADIKEIANWAVADAFGYYEQLLKLGVRKEDARYVLPQGCTVNMVTTLNLRSLWDVYQKRVQAPGAQAEIKTMVQYMVDRTLDELPWMRELYDV